MTDPAELLDELRPVSFAIAYRMLGSVAEAEDIVQEALLRVSRAIEADEGGVVDMPMLEETVDGLGARLVVAKLAEVGGARHDVHRLADAYREILR